MSGVCAVPTLPYLWRQSLQKMNLDSDEDMTKEKRSTDLTFSDSRSDTFKQAAAWSDSDLWQ